MLTVKVWKEGRRYLASSEEFNLHAEDKTEAGVLGKIKEAFFFAIEQEDFARVYADKLAELYNPRQDIFGCAIAINIEQFLARRIVTTHVPFTSDVCTATN